MVLILASIVRYTVGGSACSPITDSRCLPFRLWRLALHLTEFHVGHSGSNCSAPCLPLDPTLLPFRPFQFCQRSPLWYCYSCLGSPDERDGFKSDLLLL